MLGVYCDYLLMFPCLGVGKVLNKEKRNRLAELIAHRQAALTDAGGSAPAGPITVVEPSGVQALKNTNPLKDVEG